jgi:1-acyl-sn-glycerol-3-phosphate acyltransferase
MAVDAGAPIVPIVLKGTRTIMEKSSLRINTGEVSMNIEAPVATADFTRENKDDLIESIRAVIREGLEKGN